MQIPIILQGYFEKKIVDYLESKKGKKDMSITKYVPYLRCRAIKFHELIYYARDSTDHVGASTSKSHFVLLFQIWGA